VDSQHRPQDITDIAENWSRLTLQVPLVEQELLTLLGHLSSPPVFNGVRITPSLV
jgi:hypothetical protein